MPESFKEKRERYLRERAAERGELPPPTPEPPEFRKDQVPDVLSGQPEEESEIDQMIKTVGIVRAYNLWCGKSVPDDRGKTEGIMVSCPNPQHPDKNPSAWLNTDKNTWFCSGCAEGGDLYDIAAFKFGYKRPDYKFGAEFHKLRKDIAEALGYTFKRVPGGEVLMPPKVPVEPEPPSQPPSLAIVQEPEDNVTPIDGGMEDADELVRYPTIDWRKLVQPDTFLYKYLEACSQDDSPEEYHFWHGLIALGHAVGRNVVLDDHQPVFGNLLVCLLGGTGAGKSRSRNWLNTVVREALPFHDTGLGTTGVKLIPVPGSGEFLVKQFSYEARDPANVKRVLGFMPVNGIVDFDELSALLGRANRQGSTLKSTIMGFADTRHEVTIGGLSHGIFHAEQPFCSITASTQPKAVKSLLNRTDTGSGFLNRWLFAGGPSKEREILGGAHSSITVNLDSAIEELKKVRGYGGTHRKLILEPDALEALTKFFRQMVHPLQTKDESDLLKRLDLLFKKLMLLFTINLKRETVSLEIVDMCIGLWEYIIDCYAILNENIGVTHSSEIAQEILRIIRNFELKYKKGPSARDIARYTARKNYSPEQIKKALEVMTALDWIDIQKKRPGDNMGRRTVRYTAVGE